MPSFKAKIIKIGINPLVDVPQTVLKELFDKAGKSKGPIPVKGKLNGKSYLQTMVKFKGKWRLYLNTPMRRAAGIDEGDMASVQIDFDPKPRILTMHPELKKAFQQNKGAHDVYKKLAPYRQKEIIRYLNSMKTKKSVERNIGKILNHLTGKHAFAGRTL